jgi:uncharacterized protein (DUF1684 family)
MLKGDVLAPTSSLTRARVAQAAETEVSHVGMTVVEFLEARVAEDELTAQAAVDSSPSWRVFYDYRDVKDADGYYVVQADGSYPSAEQAAHIARHDPARVLRECTAIRAVIAEVLRRAATDDDSDPYLEDLVRELAAVYADHPDYDASWA